MNKPQAIITGDNQLQCHLHQQPINRFYCNPTGVSTDTLQLLCPHCETKTNKEPQLVVPQAYSSSKSFIISLPDVKKLPEDPSFLTKAPINFSSTKLESFIYDYNSCGYYPRSIVYIHDQNLLVACSLNGTTTLWSLGNTIENVSTYKMQAGAKCVKYIKTKNQRKLLVAGTDYGVYIYEIEEGGSGLAPVTKLNCEMKITDMEYIEDQEMLIVVGTDHFIRVWKLEDFTFLGKFDVQEFIGLQDQLYTVIFIKETNQLALEYSQGFFVAGIILTKEGGFEFEFEFGKATKIPQHYSITDKRQAAGLLYLPKTNRFLLRTSRTSWDILDAETFKNPISIGNRSESGYLFPLIKLIANEQEDQIITCGNYSEFFVYLDGQNFYKTEYLNGLLTKCGTIEIIPDQYRIIIGDEYTGTLLVLRTNVPNNSPFSNSGTQQGFFANNNFVTNLDKKSKKKGKKDKNLNQEESKDPEDENKSSRRSTHQKSKNRSQSRDENKSQERIQNTKNKK